MPSLAEKLHGLLATYQAADRAYYAQHESFIHSRQEVLRLRAAMRENAIQQFYAFGKFLEDKNIILSENDPYRRFAESADPDPGKLGLEQLGGGVISPEPGEYEAVEDVDARSDFLSTAGKARFDLAHNLSHQHSTATSDAGMEFSHLHPDAYAPVESARKALQEAFRSSDEYTRAKNAHERYQRYLGKAATKERSETRARIEAAESLLERTLEERSPALVAARREMEEAKDASASVYERAKTTYTTVYVGAYQGFISTPEGKALHEQIFTARGRWDLADHKTHQAVQGSEEGAKLFRALVDAVEELEHATPPQTRGWVEIPGRQTVHEHNHLPAGSGSAQQKQSLVQPFADEIPERQASIGAPKKPAARSV